ncbi:MAG: hypothetical protein J7L03_06965 [Caldisericaceae bacterium]|nr:hypothetical protein [Caldisericaceae bacterium]
MNGMPIPDERMDQFKYLAFLSYTAKHFKKLSKKKKTLIFVTVGLIAAIIALIVFLRLIAFNPIITITPAADNSAYDKTVQKDSIIMREFAKEGLVSSFDFEKVFSGSGAKIVIHLPEQTNANKFAQDALNKIFDEPSNELKFNSRFCTAYCKIYTEKTKAGSDYVKIFLAEVPKKSLLGANTYFTGLSAYPDGMFSRIIIPKNCDNAYSIRLKSAKSIGKIGLQETGKLLTVFTGEDSYKPNVVYIYDISPVYTEGCCIRHLKVNFSASSELESLSRLIFTFDNAKTIKLP